MKLLLSIAFLVFLPLAVFAQARTASELQDVPFSSLDVGNPPIRSIRYCINCKRTNGPCEVAPPGFTPIGADALKTPNGWMCNSRAAGAGTATVSAVTVGSLPPIFTSSVANATTTPAISFLLTAQNAKLFLAGPASGGPAAPTFRSIGSGDFITGTIVNSRCLRTDGSGNVVVAAADCGSGSGGITNSAGNNVIPKSDGANLVASQISDDGTDVSLATGGLNLVSGGKVRFSLNEIAYVNTLGPTFFDGTTNRTWRLNVQNLTGTRTQTVPDANGTLALLGLAQTWTADQTFAGVSFNTPFTLGGISVLPTGTELNFVDGVTSAIQTQLNAKVGGTGTIGTLSKFTAGSTLGDSLITESGTTINTTATSFGLPATTSLIFGGSDVFGYANGVGPRFLDGTAEGIWTINLQSVTGNHVVTPPNATGTMPLLNLAQTWTANQTFNNTVSFPTPFNLGGVSVTPTGTELNFVDGVTSAIQTQIDGKQASDADLTDLADGTLTGTKVDQASDTVRGTTEHATIAETTTGTDATRSVTPDGLAGSDFGKRQAQILVIDDATAVTTGDGKWYFYITNELDGWLLVAARAAVGAAVSSSGAVTVDLDRCGVVATGVRCSGTNVSMLSTLLTVDANEDSSDTAATPAVINTSNDDLTKDQWIRINVDGAGTGTQGLYLILIFQKP